MAWTPLPSTPTTGQTITTAWGAAVNDDLACCPTALAQARGDTFHATGANAMSRLAIGAADAVYASTGSVPNWVTALNLRQYMCHATVGGNMNIAISGTWLIVTFSGASFQVGTLWTDSAPSRITIPQTGIYYVAGLVHWPDGSYTAKRAARLRVNGTPDNSCYSFRTHSGMGALGVIHTIANIRAFSVNDYCELQVYQNEGVNLRLESRTWLAVYYLGKSS